MRIVFGFILSFCFIGTHFLLVAERSCITIPYYPVRSAHEDSYYELINWTRYHELWEQGFSNDISLAVHYKKSFQAQHIARALFGQALSCDCDSMKIHVAGSRVVTRDAQKSWLADYFGLPPDFNSFVFVNPSIQDIILDLNMQIWLDSWMRGAYFHLQAPLVFTRWDLNLKEAVIDPGSQGYIAGYMSPQAVPRDQLLNNFTEFITGTCNTPNLGNQVRAEPLQASRMSLAPLRKVAVAALEGILGWQIIQEEDYFFGINLRAVIPTGNKPRAEFLFEPMVGTGGHPELGGGLLFYVNLWRDCYCPDKELGFYLVANATHLFEVMQRRSFDLIQGNNSRYMLTEHMSRLIEDGLRGDNGIPDAQFNDLLVPAANLTTLAVEVSIAWQLDFSMLLDFAYNQWSWQLGYNYWTRQPESIEFLDLTGTNRFKGQTWAAKGDSQLFGFREDNDIPVALSATQDSATVYTGLNYRDFNIARGIRNPDIDHPELATADGVDLLAQPGSGGQTHTSVQPVFLTLADLAICRSRTYAITQSVFWNMQYIWPDFCEVAPYLTVGGKVEFSSYNDENSCGNCTGNINPGFAPCGVCLDAARPGALSLWSLWVQAGVSF